MLMLLLTTTVSHQVPIDLLEPIILEGCHETNDEGVGFGAGTTIFMVL